MRPHLALIALASCGAFKHDIVTLQADIVTAFEPDVACKCDMFQLALPPPAPPPDLALPADQLDSFGLIRHNEYARTLDRWARLYAWPTCGETR